METTTSARRRKAGISASSTSDTTTRRSARRSDSRLGLDGRDHGRIGAVTQHHHRYIRWQLSQRLDDDPLTVHAERWPAVRRPHDDR